MKRETPFLQRLAALPRGAVSDTYRVLWRSTEVSRVSYVALGAAASLILSALAMGLFRLVAVPGLGLTPPRDSDPLPHRVEMLVGWVVVAPLAETLILGTLLGLAHGLLGIGSFDVAGHAVVSTVGFFVFAAVFVAWRRESFRDAFWMCASVHMVHNLAVVVVASLEQAVRHGGVGG